MTTEEYLKYHLEVTKKLHEIAIAKNSDYTGTTDDPFYNFKSGSRIGVSVEQSLMIRMGDKISRIESFIQKGGLAVKSESVEDTLLDLANYCILLAAHLSSKNISTPSMWVGKL
jgi:hypothetical protein